MSKKERIDILLVVKGMVESRALAQRLIMAGQVTAGGERVHKASERFLLDVELAISELPRYVSRGGEKLEAALQAFPVEVAGMICADLGSSTGGFTDCLLQHGAERVYAIDVGKGQLHWSLRQDERVVVMEGVNARHLHSLPEAVRIVTIDAAFISLNLLLPRAADWLDPAGDVIALVKPQFEAGVEKVGKGGIVKTASVHKEVLEAVIGYALRSNLGPRGLIRSPIHGAKGNLEFLLWMRKGDLSVEPRTLIDSAFME